MMVRICSDGWSYQRCSSSVSAPGWGNFGWLPNPPFTGSNTASHLTDRVVQQLRATDLAGRSLVQILGDDAADRLRLGLHLVGPGAVRVEHARRAPTGSRAARTCHRAGSRCRRRRPRPWG